jgi:hypothetical protein
MPAGKVVDSETLFDADPMARPYVVKPVNEGSSVGVAIVTDDGNYGNPIGRDVEGPWHQFKRLLAEPFVKGRELTVAVMDGEAMAVTELKPTAGFYDYDAKYTDGLTVHVCPAEVPDDIAQSMLDMAAKAHRLLGCKGASRSDFRWDDEQGEAGLYLLEVNTQPGMTPLSLVPEQAKLKGISYGELVERLMTRRSMSAAHGAAWRSGGQSARRHRAWRSETIANKLLVNQARATASPAGPSSPSSTTCRCLIALDIQPAATGRRTVGAGFTVKRVDVKASANGFQPV